MAIPERRRTAAKLTWFRKLDLQDISFSSSFCCATVHSAAATRSKRAFLTFSLHVTPEDAQVQVVKDFNEFSGAIFSASIQTSCSTPNELLRVAVHLRRLQNPGTKNPASIAAGTDHTSLAHGGPHVDRKQQIPAVSYNGGVS